MKIARVRPLPSSTRRLALRAVPLLAALLCMTGCTYVTAVSQTNVPKERGRIVRAHSKRYIVLGFNFDNDYPFKLIQDLQGKCPNGQVRGLLTKDTMTMYFLAFFWSREQLAEGYCVRDEQSADAGPTDESRLAEAVRGVAAVPSSLEDETGYDEVDLEL
jgi:hypothetical protein